MASNGDGPQTQGGGMVATRAGRPYRILLDTAVEIAGSDAASIQIYDEETSGLRLADWRGFHPESAQFWDLVVPESASTCGMALVTGARVVVPDLEADAALAGSDDLLEYRRSRLAAVQSTPLVTDDGRIVGMISTHWRKPHEPAAAELRRIDSLARRCAAAIASEQRREVQLQSLSAPLLRAVNQRIREMAEQFDSLVSDVTPQEYLCECGCGVRVALTSGEFDARITAQEPVTAHGHVIGRAQAARKLSLQEDAAALRRRPDRSSARATYWQDETRPHEAN